MDTADHEMDSPGHDDDDDDLETQRTTIRASLAEIGAAVAIRMRNADLHFPLGIAVPTFGALLTMMTPNDPTD